MSGSQLMISVAFFQGQEKVNTSPWDISVALEPVWYSYSDASHQAIVDPTNLSYS